MNEDKKSNPLMDHVKKKNKFVISGWAFIFIAIIFLVFNVALLIPIRVNCDLHHDYYDITPAGLRIMSYFPCNIGIEDAHYNEVKIVPGTWKDNVIKPQPEQSYFSSGINKVTVELEGGYTLTAYYKTFDLEQRRLRNIILFIDVPALLLIYFGIILIVREKKLKNSSLN